MGGSPARAALQSRVGVELNLVEFIDAAEPTLYQRNLSILRWAGSRCTIDRRMRLLSLEYLPTLDLGDGDRGLRDDLLATRLDS